MLHHSECRCRLDLQFVCVAQLFILTEADVLKPQTMRAETGCNTLQDSVAPSLGTAEMDSGPFELPELRLLGAHSIITMHHHRVAIVEFPT